MEQNEISLKNVFYKFDHGIFDFEWESGFPILVFLMLISDIIKNRMWKTVNFDMLAFTLYMDPIFIFMSTIIVLVCLKKLFHFRDVTH